MRIIKKRNQQQPIAIPCDIGLSIAEQQRIASLLADARECRAPVAAIKIPPARFSELTKIGLALFAPGTVFPTLPRFTVFGIEIQAEEHCEQIELCVWAVPMSSDV